MALIFRRGGNDSIFGTNKFDLIFAGAGDDEVDAKAGKDIIVAGRGNDTVKGGSGADIVLAGRGDDIAIFNLAENAANGHGWDRYDGGKGQDTLRLELTSEEWASSEIQTEILAYFEFLKTASGKKKFNFETLKLSVSKFELVELIVDGEPINPLQEVVDLSDSTSNETIEITSQVGSVVTTGSGSDNITGNIGNDVILSGSGSDFIYPDDGNDYVDAGSGDDTIVAGQGAGDDIYIGGAGNDTITYTSAENRVVVDLREIDRSAQTSAFSVTFATIGELLSNPPAPAPSLASNTPTGFAEGEDVDLDALIGIENVISGNGDDFITGSDSDNLIESGAGNDEVNALGGNDFVRGGTGNDTLNGGSGDDTLVGGEGNDTIIGGLGNDTIILSGNSTEYLIENVAGSTYRITDSVAGRDGVDTFSNISLVVFADVSLFDYQLPPAGPIEGTEDDETLIGTTGPDSFFSFGGNDTILGDDGGDYILADAGNDNIDAGEGFDTVDYTNSESPIIVNLVDGVNGTVAHRFGGVDYLDTITNTEFIFGTIGDDEFNSSETGGAIYEPFGGNDVVTGGAGFDGVSYGLLDQNSRGFEVIFSTTEAGNADVVVDTQGDRDTLISIENVAGSQNSDIFLGGAGDQVFADGNPDISPGDPVFGTSDLIDGGDGFDTLDVTGPLSVSIDMENALTPEEVTQFVDDTFGGFAALHPDTAARLQSDLTGFFWFTNGAGETSIARSIESVDLFRGASDFVAGDSGANVFSGFAGDDELLGRGGDDFLFGGLGNDILDGGSEQDSLAGGAGTDVLIGGAGDDEMAGGIDADEFQFNPGDGNDTISDFELLSDSLILSGGLTIENLSEADINGDGELDTTVEFSSGDSVTLLFVSGITDPNDLL